METLKVYSPYDRHQIDEFPLLNEQELQLALSRANKLFNDRSLWLPRYERIAILEKALQILTPQQEELARTAAAEGGKPLQDSRVEVARALQGIKYAIGEIEHLSGQQIPMDLTPAGAHRLAFTTREPRGVVLAISAFNHPFNLIVHQVIPAIATGCPVLIKPASTTPRSCLNIINALYQAGLPPEWCQAVISKSSNIEKLVSDPRISFLSFIGSGLVGWHLRTLCAPGTPCALEHGGIAPVIITADADLEDTLPLIVKGGFYHAGQVCVSVQRIFVHQDIVNNFISRLVSLVEKLKVGDPLNETTEVGPLIQPQEVNRIDTWIKEAVTAGAKILCGGHAISETCYAPTVVFNPPPQTKLSSAEVFGPVVCVYSYSDPEEVIRIANGVPFAFQAAVFAKQIDNAWYFAQRLEANTVLINDHTAFRVDWMPFGGRKQSGLSVGGIPYTMHDMTYEKLFVMRSRNV